jgi:hypothetical protein
MKWINAKPMGLYGPGIFRKGRPNISEGIVEGQKGTGKYSILAAPQGPKKIKLQELAPKIVVKSSFGATEIV